MTTNVLIPHVRRRIFRHYSALAGGHTRFSLSTTASSASPTCHPTKSSSTFVALDTLLLEWKAGDTKLARGQDKKEWTINCGQEMFAGQKWNAATVLETLGRRDAASSVTRCALSDSDESGPDTRKDVSTERFCANDPKGYNDADTHGESSDSSLDAGDPFNCDHIGMRLAKARSKYAWVTCQTEFEQFVLQAQGLLYFCIERNHDAENVTYNVGYALKRDGDAGRGSTSLKGANDFHSLFNDRNNVGQTSTREHAFRLAEILIEKMVTDKKLLRTMRRTARWRSKPCTLEQMNMLLIMQTESQKAQGVRKREARSYDLFGGALFLNAGELSCLLSGFYFSHFYEPQNAIAVSPYTAATASYPPSLTEIASRHGGKRVDPANGFWR